MKNDITFKSFISTLSLILVFSCSEKLSPIKKNPEYQTTIGDNSPEKQKEKKISIVSKLKEIDSLPVQERITLYHYLKNNEFDAYDFSNETELTLYAYAYLWDNNLNDALPLFELIISEFPNSSNAYDSMGEAFLQAGDSAKALTNYLRSYELDPGNFLAEDVIEQLKNPHLKPLTVYEKFEKIYSKQEYLEDLDMLAKRLLEIHPAALKFISEEEFWKNIEAKKALINDKTSYAEFAWHCNAIIASINCSHTTSSKMNNQYHEFAILPLKKTFPLQVRWIKDQLFVVDPLNNNKLVNKKDEILSINGIESSKIIADIYNHISAQANIQTYKNQKFNEYHTFLIPYSLGLPSIFEITVKGSKTPIKLQSRVNFDDPYYTPFTNSCEQDLCLEIVDTKTAVLSIKSFNYYEWADFPVFKKFIDSSISVIHEKQISNLIIDVRFNSGGSQYPSIYLLQHLVSKPFSYYSKSEFPGKVEKFYGEGEFEPHAKRFKGKVYFLIDGNGNSTTGHFMSMVKALNLGTIIGEELGSNQFCTAGQKMCRLKNTKLVYSVANNTHISTATNLPDAVGILPDYEVIQTIDQYFLKQDVVKEFALKLIKK